VVFPGAEEWRSWCTLRDEGMYVPKSGTHNMEIQWKQILRELRRPDRGESESCMRIGVAGSEFRVKSAGIRII
jgi:hypothetical protein